VTRVLLDLAQAVIGYVQQANSKVSQLILAHVELYGRAVVVCLQPQVIAELREV